MIKRVIRNSITKNEILFETYSNLRFLIQIIKTSSLNPKELKLFLKVKPYTMVSLYRLQNIYKLARTVEKNSLVGAFVECGVWRGGCSAVMAYAAKEAQSNRKIWLFDSFRGLPEPTKKDGSRARVFSSNRTSGSLRTINKNVGTVMHVKKILSKLNVDINNVEIRKGWFQNTLPKAKKEIENIAILRLDSDWYESTKACLENLYDLVVKGGFVVIDDYGTWEGCRKAVDNFIKKRGLRVKLIWVDNAEVYFKKV